jgi:hypothetical protein
MLREETLEKVTQGYARLVTWAELKLDLPKDLKISPIAAIPLKSVDIATSPMESAFRESPTPQ